MRLIDGEELKQIVIGVWNDIDRYVEGDISLSDIIGIIDDMPTIEPEIVRCKDCKYSDTDNTLGVMFCWRISYHEANEDGFCSWAERRTDEPN